MEKKEILKKEAKDLVSKIIDNFEIEVTQEDEFYHLVIKAEDDAPVVIGRYGETIRALQRLLEVIMFKKLGEKLEILVDVNDFRAKQKDRLQDKAKEWAEQAISEDRPIYIRNLSSYERKLIHEFIGENYPELTTSSIGLGRGRKLIIEKKQEENE